MRIRPLGGVVRPIGAIGVLSGVFSRLFDCQCEQCAHTVGIAVAEIAFNPPGCEPPRRSAYFSENRPPIGYKTMVDCCDQRLVGPDADIISRVGVNVVETQPDHTAPASRKASLWHASTTSGQWCHREARPLYRASSPVTSMSRGDGSASAVTSEVSTDAGSFDRSA